jgi:predicted peptidase
VAVLRLAAAGKKFPFIVVAPQCPERRNWDADELIGLLNDLEKKFRVDRSREYLTGISMGGFGTWALVAAQPKRFAAIAPVCGGGDPLLASTFAKVPTWVVHGDKDPAVAFSQSVAMVDAMKEAGGSPIFTQVVGGTHDVWTEFYLKDEFYEWLLKFRRR